MFTFKIVDISTYAKTELTKIFFLSFFSGGNLEGHVIFSPKSYIPRTIMSNLTLDMFGESVNVVEVEARVEGMEHLVEAVFGPAGPISATNVNTQVDRALRFFRSAAEDVKTSDDVNSIPNVIDNNFKVPKVCPPNVWFVVCSQSL